MNFEKIGITAFATSTPKFSGTIKQQAQDFVVQEITSEKEVCSLEPSSEIPEGEAEYTHFTLVKQDWQQAKALQELSRRFGKSRKRFTFAGTKDKKALTAQRISAWKITPQQFSEISLQDCKIGDFTLSDNKLELGDLWGNCFTITIHNCSADEKTIKQTITELEKLGGMPNFFGQQRFGNRLNNHIVGKHLILNDMESAIKEYLAGTSEIEKEEGRSARTFLAENWGEFSEAIKKYPNYMRQEKSLLNHLIKHPNDYVGAFKILPKFTYKIFTHAYQSYLFNLQLSEKLKSKGPLRGEGNLLGYESKPNDIEAILLEKESLQTTDFKIKSFPEASVRGNARSFLAKLEFTKLKKQNSDLELQFNLEKGAYATILLQEFIN